MLGVEWIKDSGIIESHLFLLDSEGLGLTDFYRYKSHDTTYLDRVYKQRTGGLGGQLVKVEMSMAAYMVKTYRDRTIKNDKSLPDGLDMSYYDSIDTSKFEPRDILELTCKDIHTDNEFVNYCVMRFIARDKEGLLYISGSEEVANHHISQINGALLYNRIEKRADDRFVCLCAYEDKDGYYEAKLIVTIEKELVEEHEGIYRDLIDIEEYRCNYSLRSIIVVDKYQISDYDAFMLITKPELIRKYRINAPESRENDLESLEVFRDSIINMCPGIQVNSYEKGLLMTQYYLDNSHVEEDEYIINNDIMFNIYINSTDLFLAAYDEDEMDQIAFAIEKIFSSYLIEDDMYEFDDLVLFDFIESGNDDFDDFLDN